jgi:hypothetical protein
MQEMYVNVGRCYLVPNVQWLHPDALWFSLGQKQSTASELLAALSGQHKVWLDRLLNVKD